MIVIDPQKTFRCVPESQKKKKDASVFIVRALSVRERHLLFKDGDEIGAFWGVLNAAVTGWENFKGGDGEPLEYSPDLLEHCPEADVNDAFSFILKLTNVSAEEAGK